MAKVRTNIEIEDSYVNTVMDRYGVRTRPRQSISRYGIWLGSR